MRGTSAMSIPVPTIMVENQGSTNRGSQETIAAVDQLAVYNASFGHKLMTLWWFGFVDMQDLMAMGYQPIRNQHAMTVEIKPLGAHVGSAIVLGQFDKLGRTALELRSEHMVGVVAKALVAQGDVRRIIANFLAASAKFFQPNVINSVRRQRTLQRFAIKVREAPRRGQRANVNNSADLMGMEHRKKIVQGARGMADGVESRHGIISTQRHRETRYGLCCSLSAGQTRNRLHHDVVLLGKHGAQVE